MGAGGGGWLSLDVEDAMVFFLVRLRGAIVFVPGCCVRGNVESARFFLLLGDVSEILQRLNFVRRFLAWMAPGMSNIRPLKSGSESLKVRYFFRNGTPLGKR